jgi:anti-sigma regulatory factor (Ser/Thr protein kinase)
MNVADFERRGPGRGAELRLSVPPDPKQGLIVRREVLAFAEQHDIGGDDVMDFVAAIGEALANAIEHARTDEPIEIVMWLIDTDRLFASITDKGIGFSPNERPLDSLLPDAFAERGRGLPIMRRCSDIFNVHSAPGQGTHVTLGCFVQRAARSLHEPARQHAAS